MSKLTSKTSSLTVGNGVIARALTVLYVLLFINAYGTVTQLYSSNYAPGTQANIDLQNYARGFSIAMLVILAILTIQQKDYYFWFKKNKASKLDERQLSIQQRIMQRSYNFTILILFISLYEIVNNKVAIAAALQQTANSAWIWLPFNVLMLVCALPLIMATWRKDTYLNQPVTKSSFSGRKLLLLVWLFVPVSFLLSFIFTEIANTLNSTNSVLLSFNWLVMISVPLAMLATIYAIIAGLLKWTMSKK